MHNIKVYTKEYTKWVVVVLKTIIVTVKVIMGKLSDKVI